MSYIIPHALESALGVPDLDTKITALAGYISEIAKRHDHRFVTVTYIDQDALNARDRNARHRVMGNPARYIEVLYQGDDGPWEVPDDVRHRFAVFVYRGVGRSVTGGQEEHFRALMENRSAETPGILFALRAQNIFSVQDGPYAGFSMSLGQPQNVTAALVQTPDATDWRHEAAFTITVA